MFLLFVFLTLLSVSQRTDTASQQATTKAITEIEQRYTAALVKKDHVVFDELLADDLLHIGFEGQIADKTEYMTFFKLGSWQYQKYETSNVKIKALGNNVAVVTGRADRAIVVNSKETIGAFAFTHVWSRTGNRWQLTSSHVTTVPKPSGD